jgi:hypothetical protein
MQSYGKPRVLSHRHGEGYLAGNKLPRGPDDDRMTTVRAGERGAGNDGKWTAVGR